MKNAHILRIEFFPLQTYLANGYFGAGIYLAGTSAGKLLSTCKVSYSMYADMSTLREGDIIFVHDKEFVYGGFEAASVFGEDPGINPSYLSQNLYFRPGNVQSLFQYQGQAVLPAPNPSDFRRIGMRNLLRHGNACTFTNGVHSTQLFRLKSQGRLWSIPERWIYGEGKRAIRPLMQDEADVIIEAIELQNSGIPSRQQINSAALNGYIPINPNLNPANFANQTINEKLIEAWIARNIGLHPLLDSILGPFTCFANDVPIGYLKLMDLYGYTDLPSGGRLHKVIEVKKGGGVYPDDIVQLVKYMQLLTRLHKSSHESSVHGFLFARAFDQQTIDFVSTRNRMDDRISLVKFDYSPPTYTGFTITQIA